MQETFIPASSNISQIDYDSDTQKLTVTFQDARSYEYSGVPVTVFMGLQNAGRNVGSYFYRQVRTAYPYQEI